MAGDEERAVMEAVQGFYDALAAIFKGDIVFGEEFLTLDLNENQN